MRAIFSTPESKLPLEEWLSSFFLGQSCLVSTLHTHTPHTQFSFFCFCAKGICIKTGSLLLGNSSAPAACAMFPIKILGFQPPHHLYTEQSELASLVPFSPPKEHQALGSQTRLLCASTLGCVCLGPRQPRVRQRAAPGLDSHTANQKNFTG